MVDWFEGESEENFWEDGPAPYGDKLSREEYVARMRKRTKAAAVSIINFMEDTRPSPHSAPLTTIRHQLIRSATSAGANYRAACVARSGREFFAKLSIVVEEADETVYWLELLYDSKINIDRKAVVALGKEWRELTKIISAARRTYRNR